MSVITKKPKSTKLKAAEVDKLIAKGGDVPPVIKGKASKRVKKKPQKKIPVQLRLPQDLIDRIDGLLDSRLVNISRHTWFLEAIESKIIAESASET